MPSVSSDAQWLHAGVRPLILAAAALAMAAAVLVAVATPAAACSCAGPPFEANEEFGVKGLSDFDAAFIGTVVGSDTFGQQTQWTFDIDSVLLGDLATPIDVITASDGGACGFENLSAGQQRAVGLIQRSGEWESGLCSIDSVDAVDGIGERRAPELAAPSNEGQDDGLSSGGGWGLALIGAGFAAVAAVAAGAVLVSRRQPGAHGAGSEL